MNDKFRKLLPNPFAVDYQHDDNGPLDLYTEKEMQRFAELIVRECVAQIQPMWNRVQEFGPPPRYDYDTFDLAYNDSMNAIKEHFGVEG